MYARVSRAKCKPGRTAEVKAMIEGLKGRVDEADGVQHWISLLTADGELIVAAFFQDEQALKGARDLNDKRWADAAAADLIQAGPDISHGEVLAFVST
jgi:hypothetical protein